MSPDSMHMSLQRKFPESKEIMRGICIGGFCLLLVDDSLYLMLSH